MEENVSKKLNYVKHKIGENLGIQLEIKKELMFVKLVSILMEPKKILLDYLKKEMFYIKVV